MKINNTSKKSTKIIKILNSIFYFFLIITFSINFVIYFRPFYYWQIKSLNIQQTSGYDYQTIKTAYDSIMNYLTLFADYSVGSLKSSAEGQAHFNDVKILFIICLTVFLISLIAVISISFYKLKHKAEFQNTKFTQSFYASISIIIFFAVITILSAIDFNKAFVIFHKIFFIGKDNWLFDPNQDEIIKILPGEFFRNCAIFVFVIMFSISFSTIIYNIIRFIKLKAKAKKTAIV
ncbi:TIGR01906 family membrane protein [Mycoplasma putrefaciens]|uniref:Integral membrane protein TIGR01906 n=1 Tax=Mycoplasma putrefaciens (strain ATCC 15718 / NCTC 10155 / C30 KS-1 / KS-1) TaxID=743965 RepID=A0A7U4E9D3_MYCPK|nr:TIGR01906 family membrane protein [Mycoplasma putrefaciens]AEM68742.1 uncharacterized protein MPUT_0365 [Mycoplasma putrefaciens KS1]